MKLKGIIPWVVLAVVGFLAFNWLRSGGGSGGSGGEGAGGSSVLNTGYGLPSPNLALLPLYPGSKPVTIDVSSPMQLLAKSQAGPGIETFTTYLQRLYVNTPQTPSAANYGIINNPVPFGATIGLTGQVNVGGKVIGNTVQGVPPNALDWVQSAPMARTRVGTFNGQPTYAYLGGGGGGGSQENNVVNFVNTGKGTPSNYFPQAAVSSSGGGTISTSRALTSAEMASTVAKYQARGWL